MKMKALLCLATGITLVLGSAANAETVWKMATKMPVDSPEGQIFQKFADLTDEYTGGELKITVYPNEQLGKEDAVLEQLQANIVQIYAEGFGYMKKWEPALGWLSGPFLAAVGLTTPASRRNIRVAARRAATLTVHRIARGPS